MTRAYTKLIKLEEMIQNKQSYPKMKIDFIYCDQIVKCNRPFMDEKNEWATDEKGNCLHQLKGVMV